MSQPPPAKRTRTSQAGGSRRSEAVQTDTKPTDISSESPASAPNPAPPSESPTITPTAISTLSTHASHALIYELFTLLPQSAPTITSYLSNPANKAQPPQPKPLDFTDIVRSLTRTVDQGGCARSSHQLAEAAGQVSSELDTAMEVILEGCRSSPRVETRETAISVMCEIASLVKFCDEDLAEMLQEESVLETLSDGAEQVLSMMRERGEDIADALKELEEYDEDYGMGMFEGTREAFADLSDDEGESDGGDESEEGGEGEEGDE